MAEPITLLRQEDLNVIESINALSEDEKQKLFSDNPAAKDYYDTLVKRVEAPRTPIEYDPTTLQSGIQTVGKGLTAIGETAETLEEKLPPVQLLPFVNTQDILNAYKNIYKPIGMWLDDEEKLRQAGEVGIDINATGADLLRRLKSGFGSRQLSFEDTKKLLSEQLGKEPYYMEDIEGVGVVFQENKGDRLVAFNRPGADVGDVVEFIGEEALPLGLDVATQIALTKNLKRLPQSTLNKVFSGASTATTSGVTTYMGELTKLKVGQDLFGLNKDKNFTDLLEESVNPALLSAGGTAAFNLVGTFATGLYRAFNQGKIPNEVVNDINETLLRIKEKGEGAEVLPTGEIPNFKPTLGQRTKDPELLALEDAFINAPQADKNVRRKYLEQLQDNEEALVEYATKLADEFGLDYANQAIETFGRNFKSAAGDKVDVLKQRVLDSYKLSRQTAGSSIKGLDGYEGAAGDLGLDLLTITNKSADELTEGDTVLQTLLNRAKEQSNTIFETVKQAVGVLPARQTNTYNVLKKLVDDPGERSIFTALNDPTFTNRVFPDPAEAKELLLRLSNRDANGRFTTPLNLSELIATRKFLNMAKGGKKDIDLDVREVNELLKAIDQDITDSLKSADLKGGKVVVEGQELLPSEAWRFANDRYTQANKLGRKQFIGEVRAGKIQPSQLFDMTMSKSVRGARTNEYFDDLYEVLELGDDKLITDLRFAFGERLKDTIKDTNIANRNKAVNEFLDLHSGIFKKLYPTKGDQSAFRLAARDLDNVAKSKIKYDNAIDQINKKYGQYTGKTDDVIQNIYSIFKGTPEESLLQLNGRRKELAKILNTSPELKNQFQYHLQQVLLRDMKSVDPFYGDILDLDKLVKIIQDPNFEKSYGTFFNKEYINNLKKLAEVTQFTNKRIQSKIPQESRQNAKDIVSKMTTPFSEGQQAAQGILGPLNPISVKFRIYDKIQLNRGFKTLNNLILDADALDSFIKNRFSTFKNIKRTTPFGGLYARNFDDIMSDDDIPEEVRLIEEK